MVTKFIMLLFMQISVARCNDVTLPKDATGKLKIGNQAIILILPQKKLRQFFFLVKNGKLIMKDRKTGGFSEFRTPGTTYHLYETINAGIVNGVEIMKIGWFLDKDNEKFDMVFYILKSDT